MIDSLLQPTPTEYRTKIGRYAIGHRFGSLWILVDHTERLVATAVVAKHQPKPIVSIAGQPEKPRKDYSKRLEAVRTKRKRRKKQRALQRTQTVDTLAP